MKCRPANIDVLALHVDINKNKGTACSKKGYRCK
jgi:hypothetical protein